MRRRTVALAVLVVGASIAAFVPASVAGSPASEASTTPVAGVSASPVPEALTAPVPDAAEVETHVRPTNRTPPDLPEQWQRTYGGDGDDTFADVVRTADGGYLLVGWTERDGNDDAWLVKVDREGDQQWEKTLGGSGNDRFRGVARTDDSYLVAGRTDEDGSPTGWTVEVDSEGEVLAERTYGFGAFYDVVRDDAGYILAGWTRGDGEDGWLVKLDADRQEEWQTDVPTPDGYGDGVLRAVVPSDSGYYLAGKIEGDSDDGWALKVDSAGETEWTATVGGPDRDDVWAAAPGGPSPGEDGFVLTGETESDSDGPRDGWLVKFAPDGAVEWERTPGGDGIQWLDSAMRTDDGFLFTGSSDQGPNGSADGYVLATDDDGESEWERYYGTGAWDKPWPAVRAHGGGYLLAGKTMMGSDDDDGNGWLVKIGAPGDGANWTADGPSNGESTAEATDAGLADDGNTASEIVGSDTTAAPDAPGSVPGFGVGAALVALAAVLLALRR